MNKTSTKCYCGGELIQTETKGIEQCNGCERLWLRESKDAAFLLIPWKHFNVRSTSSCPRCGGMALYNVRSLRIRCKDIMCAYEWRNEPDRTSMLEHNIKEQIRALRNKMAEADDMTVFIPELKALKARLEEQGLESL